MNRTGRACGALALLIGAVAVPSATGDVAHAALQPVAMYEMSEPAGSTVMQDAGAFGLDGTIGADIDAGITSGGATGYRWPYAAPDTSPLRPQRLAVVPSDALLNPGSAEFAIEVRYRTDYPAGNIVQKGQSQTQGGYWKLEHDNGIPTCLFRRNLSDEAAVTAPTALDDGSWHTVRCVRSADDVRMFVDGEQVDRRSVSVGTIANDFQMTVGGKLSCDQKSVGCDYFSGDIDYVRIDKDVPAIPNQPPTADFTVQCASLTCTFDSSASGDPDGEIADRRWNFGDDTATSGQTPQASHTFADPGSYDVRLTIVDDAGASTSTTGTATVEEQVSKYVAIDPVRLFDTRPGETPAGYKGVVHGGTSRSVQVAGRGGIPESGVTAVALNLTAVGAEAPSFVAAGPAPLTESTTSSLNISNVGQVRANLVIVPVGPDGTISLFTLRNAHLIGDVSGYFLERQGASDDGRIVTQQPHRWFDTRTESLLGPARRIRPGTETAVDILGRAGVPEANVSAVVLNVTGTAPAGPGFVTVWADGDQPNTSSVNLNFAGETVANQVIAPVGPDGRIRFASSVEVDLVADVLGWVTGDGAPSTTSGLFVPLPPSRVFDTRPNEPTPGPKGILADGETISPRLGGVGGVPEDAAGVVLNVTLIGTAPGFATLWPAGSPQPDTSNVNVDVAGDIRPNGAIVHLGTGGRIDLYVLTSAHVLADVAGYLVD